MNKFKILILCFAFGLISINAQNSANEKLPDFVNLYVIKALNFSLVVNETPYGYNPSFDANGSRKVEFEIAKLNTLHQYYVNIYKENKTYSILPNLVKRIKEIKSSISDSIKKLSTNSTLESFYKYLPYLQSTNFMFLIEEFDDSSTPYPKTLSEIETEIDNWLENQKNETNWKQTFAIGKKLNYPKNDPSLDITKTRILEPRLIKYILISVGNAAGSDDDPYFKILETIRRICNRFKIPIENYNQFVFVDYYHLFIAENKDSIKVRKYNTLLKWALDTGNYRFLRSVIWSYDVNGNKIYNPYIDFTRIEMINGQEESLLSFFHKVRNDGGSTAIHDLGALDDIINDYERGVYYADKLLFKNGLARSFGYLDRNSEDPFRFGCGFVDEKGEVIIDFKYDYVWLFNEGLAKVKDEWHSGQRGLPSYGFIDKTGKEVIPFKYSNALSFKEGLAAVFKIGTGWGFIDKTGNEVITLKYLRVSSFSEGLSAVCLNPYTCGYIDKKGNEVIPFEYKVHNIAPFSKGVALVYSTDWDDGGYKLIDKSGKVVYKPSFEKGKAKVIVNDKEYYIDETGKCVENCD